MEETLKDIVIIYHGQCRDGFGSAYAAWKKFGDEASYVPARDHTVEPEGLTGKEIYILDFSFSRSILTSLATKNTSVMVIDHHISARADVEAFPQNIFNNDHSGAVLSWKYFHPDTIVPPLLEYIEDHDIWKFALPDNRAFNAAIGEYEMSFKSWDTLVQNLEKEAFLQTFLQTGKIIAKSGDDMVEKLMQYKERVLFEGHEVWALNVSRTFRSILGHNLATLNEESGGAAMGIVYYHANGSVNISLRSNGDFDVSVLAAKHGGGGHKNASGIEVKTFTDLPFTFIQD
jgi:oligoribonuclease NrnB/cAMP/cGMP phosphodiesterase (DHH superfamily)